MYLNEPESSFHLDHSERIVPTEKRTCEGGKLFKNHTRL